MSYSVPREVHSYDALEPGDVLLYLPCRKKIAFVSKIIMFFQKLFFGKQGYYAITHAGIYVGKDHTGHRIAHVAENGYQFRVDTLEQIDEEEKEVRPFATFRAKSKELADKIAHVVLSVKTKLELEKKKIHWSLLSTIKTIFIRSFIPAEKVRYPKDIVENTHCSRFAAQCIKRANQLVDSPCLAIRSTISPAGLFKALFEDHRFEFTIFTAGMNLYEELKKCVIDNLNRIYKRKGERAKEKYHVCQSTFDRLMKRVESDNRATHVEKAIVLFEEMKPVFAQHTQFSLRKETLSYRQLNEAALKLGIFNHEIEVATVKEALVTTPGCSKFIHV